MTKKEQIIISTGAMIGGLLLCWFSLRITLGEAAAIICVVLGLGFAVGGFISLILALKKQA